MADASPVPPFEEGPIIFTPRLVLRPLTSSELDVHNMHKLISNAEFRWFIRPANTTQTIEQTREQIVVRSSPPAFQFAVHLRVEGLATSSPKAQAGQFIGAFGCPRSVPEVGYGLHPDAQGRGLAKEALLAFETAAWFCIPSTASGKSAAASAPFVDAGGAPQPVRLCKMAQEVITGTASDHLQAVAFKGNIASCKLLEKAGYAFVEEMEWQGPMTGAAAADAAPKNCRYQKARPS